MFCQNSVPGQSGHTRSVIKYTKGGCPTPQGLVMTQLIRSSRAALYHAMYMCYIKRRCFSTQSLVLNIALSRVHTLLFQCFSGRGVNLSRPPPPLIHFSIHTVGKRRPDLKWVIGHRVELAAVVWMLGNPTSPDDLFLYLVVLGCTV